MFSFFDAYSMYRYYFQISEKKCSDNLTNDVLKNVGISIKKHFYWNYCFNLGIIFIIFGLQMFFEIITFIGNNDLAPVSLIRLRNQIIGNENRNRNDNARLEREGLLEMT